MTPELLKKERGIGSGKKIRFRNVKEEQDSERRNRTEEQKEKNTRFIAVCHYHFTL